jgi:hypothetical protein
MDHVPYGTYGESLRNADHYLVAYDHVHNGGYSVFRMMTITVGWTIWKTIAPWEWGDQTTEADLGATWAGASDASEDLANGL